MVECVILRVQLTPEGFVVAYRTVQQRSINAVILDPSAMPPGHELLCTHARVRLHFNQNGSVRRVEDAPAHRFALFRW